MTMSGHGLSSPLDGDAEAPAAALVVTFYRCAMAGFSTGQTDCWDIGWRALGEALPPGEAGPLFGQFYGFARALLATARRPIDCRPASCEGLCGDEALALRMIEAAQGENPVGVLAAAAELLGVDELAEALDATQSLARALTRRGIHLSAPRGAPCDLCPRRRLH